jgi:hypothetical protein
MKAWHNVTVETFMELRGLETIPFDSPFDLELERLSILTDTDIEELQNLDLSEFSKLTKEYAWVKSAPAKNFKQEINGFHFKEWYTLGEFIDLNHLFENEAQNFDKILSILFRVFKQDEWGNRVFEPLQFDLEQRKHEFKDVLINDCFGGVVFFVEFRDNFLKVYENLFNPVVESDELEDNELDQEDIKAEEEEKKLSKFSWERLIFDLSGGDLTKVDQLTDLPIILVFNMLSMKQTYGI